MLLHFNIKKYLLSALLCFTVFLANAQRYPFYNLGVENGLIQSQVMDIAQDRYGHLWIGTLGGLARYDGKNFTNYTVRDGMLSNQVNALDFDRSGKLWIGTANGVSEYDGRIFRHYKFQNPENPKASEVSQLKIDNNNNVWCLADNKVYNISKGKIKQLVVPGHDSSTAILPDKDAIWIARAGGPLLRYNNNQWDSFPIPLSSQVTKQPYVWSLYKDKKNRMWIGTNGALYTITNGRVALHYHKDKPLLYPAHFVSLTEDNKGDLWIGTNAGVLKLTDKALILYNRQNGLTDNRIHCVYGDVEGNIWMGSDGQGVFRFSGSPFTVLDESMGLASSQVRSLIGDRQGRVFLGTTDAGVYMYDQGKVTSLPMPNNMKPTINSMAFTNDGKLWMGTPMGLVRYDRSFRIYKKGEYDFPSYGVTSVYADKSNRLWIGFSEGALVYEKDSFRRVPVKPVLIRSFIQVGNDSILIATDNDGMKLYNAGSVRDFRTGTATDSASALCFTMNGPDELWIGTSDNGVIRYNLRTSDYLVINKNNGLRSDFIYNIIPDDNGNIWVGTGFGIHKISMASGSAPSVKFYGKNQGVTGMESNHNAVYKMNDGGIWFGTTNGALHYQPQLQTADAKPLSIVLQSIKLFGENVVDTNYYDSTDAWYKVPYGLHLPPKKNNLTFNFQAISLSGGSEQIMYRYRIEGLDAPWSDWSSTNSITFSALPSGKYILHIESNTGGELHYPFEIITPFQKTGWFRLLVLAGCILLGISLQYIANRVKQNRLKLIERTRREEQNKVRQRTAEDFHDEVGNKLTRINVLANVLKNKIQLTPDTERIISQIEDNTAQLYSGTKDILWSLKPSNDRLYEVLHRIRDFGGELFQDTEIDFIFTGTDMRWQEYKLPMDVSRNLIMIFKEALNNTLKYSRATSVKLDIRIKMRNVLQITLRDNGKGFDLEHTKRGHGIDNMQVRAKRINGRFYIDSKPGKGTIINLAFRLPAKDSKASKRTKYL